MIQLKNPLWWDGHLISEGTIICLPTELEQRLVSAGNATEYKGVREAEAVPEPPKTPPPAEDSADSEPSEASEASVDPDPELQLGRGALRI